MKKVFFLQSSVETYLKTNYEVSDSVWLSRHYFETKIEASAQAPRFQFVSSSAHQVFIWEFKYLVGVLYFLINDLPSLCSRPYVTLLERGHNY